MHRLGVLVVAVSLIAGVFAPTSTVAASSSELLELWKSGGHIAVMRHALAPGTADPETVVIGDCTTQRNLSEGGRDQARAIGAMLRANGIETAEVYTSQWCRARDTAAPFGSGRAGRQDGVELLLHPA